MGYEQRKKMNTLQNPDPRKYKVVIQAGEPRLIDLQIWNWRLRRRKHAKKMKALRDGAESAEIRLRQLVAGMLVPDES